MYVLVLVETDLKYTHNKIGNQYERFIRLMLVLTHTIAFVEFVSGNELHLTMENITEEVLMLSYRNNIIKYVPIKYFR